MAKKRRSTEVFNLSFLDVISCGFGAIILLLVLTLALEPATLARITASLTNEAIVIEDSREKLTSVASELNRELTEKREALEKPDELLLPTIQFRRRDALQVKVLLIL